MCDTRCINTNVFFISVSDIVRFDNDAIVGKASANSWDVGLRVLKVHELGFPKVHELALEVPKVHEGHLIVRRNLNNKDRIRRPESVRALGSSDVCINNH